jgi:hypothetical protein
MKRFFRIDQLYFISVLLCGMIFSSCSNNPEARRAQGDMKIKSKWVKEHFLNADPKLPFSFLYDGQASSELLNSWKKKAESTILDSNRTQYTHLWTDNKTGLEVRCVSVENGLFISGTLVQATRLF